MPGRKKERKRERERERADTDGEGEMNPHAGGWSRDDGRLRTERAGR